MTLYQYLCTHCDTLNHIHWYFVSSIATPNCCECGQDEFESYKFIKSLEVME